MDPRRARADAGPEAWFNWFFILFNMLLCSLYCPYIVDKLSIVVHLWSDLWSCTGAGTATGFNGGIGRTYRQYRSRYRILLAVADKWHISYGTGTTHDADRLFGVIALCSMYSYSKSWYLFIQNFRYSHESTVYKGVTAQRPCRGCYSYHAHAVPHSTCDNVDAVLIIRYIPRGTSTRYHYQVHVQSTVRAHHLQ